MILKYIQNDYVPQGQLEGFPLEVIDKMLQSQVEQGNEANVKVFEQNKNADKYYKGFDWENTKEGPKFWEEIFSNKNFDELFKKYPKEELPLPRVIEVRNASKDGWVKRVCFALKKDNAICWAGAETLEEAENSVEAVAWEHWREVQDEPEPEYTPFDFSDGVKNYSDLFGKKIFSKDGNYGLVINHLGFNDDKSWINDLPTCYVLENYIFEDGTPVGIKL